MIRNPQSSTDTIMAEMYFLLMLTILGYSEAQTTLPDSEVTIIETVTVTEQGNIYKLL